MRADTLALLTPAGQAALVAYGIRTILDLRLPEELVQAPNPFAQPGPHGITYTHVSFIDPALLPADGASPVFATLAAEYAYLLDQFPQQVAAILRAIAYAPAGGVLVHCTAGKDRTGLICALLLDLVGVDRATIAADYALSTECLRPRDLTWLEHGPGERAARERELRKYSPRVEIMLEVLGDLDARYGGSREYLRAAGMLPDAFQALRARFLRVPPRP